MIVKKNLSIGAILSITGIHIILLTLWCTLVIAIYHFTHWNWLAIPWLPISVIGTAVAFYVGFKNNSSYDRLWEARKIWGGIVNTSRTLIITVRDSFYLHRSEVKKDESDEVKIITNRHIAWLTALRYAMRSKKVWEASYEQNHKMETFSYNIPEYTSTLEEELNPYLSQEEFEYVMSKDNKPNAIISLQSRHLRRLTDEKKIWDFSLLNMQQMLQELTALQGKSERIKNFPYPKQYGSIGYHFVHIFMWILPIAIIPAFANIGSEMADTFPRVSEYFVWLNIPFTVIIIWIFNTMLRIGLAGENPFEGSPNDVPISNISRGITRDILQIIDEDQENIPPQFENENHIQM